MSARTHPRPIVVISRCIDFDACRYNGQVVRASLREELEPFVDFSPICPELEIGLGVPRDPVRLVRGPDRVRMIQPSTGRDLTRAMGSFSKRFLGGLHAVDGFILKSRSPSCAARNSKVFHSDAQGAGHDSGPGLFAARVLERFPAAAIEDESRLNDQRLREHFLTKLFALASFREASGDRSRDALVEFHASHKLLLMASDEARLRALGRLVADAPRRLPAATLDAYRSGLAAALASPPRPGANVNVMLHALGHVSDSLEPAERRHFLGLLDDYRARRVPLSVPLGVLGSWAARFDVGYLQGQAFFAPYPPALIRIERPPRRRRVA